MFYDKMLFFFQTSVEYPGFLETLIRDLATGSKNHVLILTGDLVFQTVNLNEMRQILLKLRRYREAIRRITPKNHRLI